MYFFIESPYLFFFLNFGTCHFKTIDKNVKTLDAICQTHCFPQAIMLKNTKVYGLVTKQYFIKIAFQRQRSKW